MEERDNNKRKFSPYLVVILLLVVLFTCTVSSAYVAITNVSTSSFLMKASKWDVHFSNLSLDYMEGDIVEVNRPSVNVKSTNINSFRVDFSGKGSISYLFDVVNDGTFDAVITSISIFKPICSTDAYEYDMSSLMVCKGFSYKLTYKDGSDVMVGDPLDKNSKKTLRFTMQYDGDYIPSSVIRISDISASIIYSEKI